MRSSNGPFFERGEVLACAECDEGLITHVSAGDETLRYCAMCESIEGRTKYITEEQAEGKSWEQ